MVLSDKQTDRHPNTQTGTTENNITLDARWWYRKY